MLASRFGKLPVTVVLIAFVVVGGQNLASPRVDPIVGSTPTTVGHGMIRAVEATIADADLHTGRSERHPPRNHDLPPLLPAAMFALALALLGTTAGRSAGPDAVARLRDSIGRRAPPTLAAR